MVSDMADANTEDAKGASRDRINLSPRPTTLRYLNQLVKLGLYGSDKTAVATRLVDEGIRRALAEGLIHRESGD